MAKIIPFKAVRPTSDKVGLVTCRNYDDYSPAELASWLDFNPYSFLHVLNPAFVHSQKITLDKRFKAVANKYHDFIEDGVFIGDEKKSFYLKCPKMSLFSIQKNIKKPSHPTQDL